MRATVEDVEAASARVYEAYDHACRLFVALQNNSRPECWDAIYALYDRAVDDWREACADFCTMAESVVAR